MLNNSDSGQLTRGSKRSPTMLYWSVFPCNLLTSPRNTSITCSHRYPLTLHTDGTHAQFSFGCSQWTSYSKWSTQPPFSHATSCSSTMRNSPTCCALRSLPSPITYISPCTRSVVPRKICIAGRSARDAEESATSASGAQRSGMCSNPG